MKVLLKDYKAYARHWLAVSMLNRDKEEVRYDEAVAIYKAKSKLARFWQVFWYASSPSAQYLNWIDEPVIRWRNEITKVEYLESIGDSHIDIRNEDRFLEWYNKEKNGIRDYSVVR